MARIIISILLLLSFTAQAQPWAMFHAHNQMPSDDLPIVVGGMYSLRKINSNYSGYAIRIGRSADTTSINIGFTGSGDLDTAAIKTFGGSGDAWAIAWYDQSGLNNTAQVRTASGSLVRTTAPLIMRTGTIYRRNGKPTLYFTNSLVGTQNQTALQITSYPDVFVQKFSVFAVFSPIAGSDGTARMFSLRYRSAATDYGDAFSMIPVIQNGGTISSWGSYQLGARASVTVSNTALNVFSHIYNASTISNSVNNGTPATYSYAGFTKNMGTARIGESDLPSTFGDGSLTGYVAEIWFYDSDKTLQRSAINTSINSYYTIY